MGVADVATIIVDFKKKKEKKEKKKKKREKEKKKKEKHQPCMGMAGMVVIDVADMASIVIIGVVVACLVSELVTILKNNLVCKKKHQKKKTKKASHAWAWLASLLMAWLTWQPSSLLGLSWLASSVNYLVSKKISIRKNKK